MPTKTRTQKVVRSASSGRFVKKAAAKRSPKSTVTETITIKKKKKPTKKKEVWHKGEIEKVATSRKKK